MSLTFSEQLKSEEQAQPLSKAIRRATIATGPWLAVILAGFLIATLLQHSANHHGALIIAGATGAIPAQTSCVRQQSGTEADLATRNILLALKPSDLAKVR